jgi:hypothetical protein
MLTSALFVLALLPAADEKVGGWPGLFPELNNFGRKVEAPRVEKAEKPKSYSQSAVYEWMGGRFEIIRITIARDPAFKEKYSADAMKKEKAEKLDVNKKTAYLWDRMKADDLEKVNRKLVIVLADDKVIIVEQRGAGLELADVAKKLDFAKVVKALESPPK